MERILNFFFLLLTLASIYSCDTKSNQSNSSTFENKDSIRLAKRAIRDSIIEKEIEPFVWKDIRFGISMTELLANTIIGKHPKVHKNYEPFKSSVITKEGLKELSEDLGLNVNLQTMVFFFENDELCSMEISSSEVWSSQVKGLCDDAEFFANVFADKMKLTENQKKDIKIKHPGLPIYSMTAGHKNISIHVLNLAYDNRKHYQNRIIIENERFPSLETKKLFKAFEDSIKNEEILKEKAKEERRQQAINNNL